MSATIKTQRSKSNLYGRLLILVLLMLITVVFTSESAWLLGNETDGPKYGGLAYSVFLSGFIIYTAPLLRNLGYNLRVTRLVYAFAAIVFIISMYVSNPFFHVVSEQYIPPLYSFFHVALIASEVLFARIILMDIFGSTSTRTDHIWGAIVVYFLLIMTFAEGYEILALYNPGILGIVYPAGWPNYVQVIMFSINVMTGMDTLYPNAHPMLFKLGQIENLIGNLFLVVILGRLLSTPLNRLKG